VWRQLALLLLVGLCGVHPAWASPIGSPRGGPTTGAIGGAPFTASDWNSEDYNSLDWSDSSAAAIIWSIRLSGDDARLLFSNGTVLINTHLIVPAGSLTVGSQAFDGEIILFNDIANVGLSLLAPDTTVEWDFTFPPDNGDPNEFLQTDGFGVTTWEVPAYIPDTTCDTEACTFDDDVIILEEQGAGDPVVDGEIEWDTTTETLKVGDDGAATLEFFPNDHTADEVGTVNDTEVCQGDAGGLVQCDIATLANLDTALGSDIAGHNQLGANLSSTTNNIISDDATGYFILGGSDGHAEDLRFRFDWLADAVKIESTTGVDKIGMGVIALETSGTVSAARWSTPLLGDWTISGSTRGTYRSSYRQTVSGTSTVTLPSAVAGMDICIYKTAATGILHIKPSTGDRISLYGVFLATENKISSNGDIGCAYCLTNSDDFSWFESAPPACLWIDGGA